jgi:WD40 repeat protein
MPAPVLLAGILGACSLVACADVAYEPLLRLGNPEHYFNDVAFTPDGQQLLSSVVGSGVVLWDLPTGQQARVFAGAIGPVAVSPDGRWGLTASETNAAKLWNLQTGELIRTLTGHTNAISAVAFSPDGRQLLTGSADSTVRLWGTEGGELHHALSLTNPVVSAVFSPDGRHVLTGLGWWLEEVGPPRLWDAQTGELVRAFEGACAAAGFAMGGRSILALRAGTYSGTSLWDVQTGQSTPLTTTVWPEFTVSPDGRLALIHGGGKGGPPRLVDLAGDRVVRWFGPNASGASGADCAAFSPDGRRLVLGAHGDSNTLWDIGDLVDWLAGGRLNQSDVVTQPLMTMGHGLLWTMAMAPDGSYFVTAGNRGTLFWDLKTGELSRRLGWKGGTVYTIDLSPDGKRVLTAGDTPERSVTMWDTQTGQPLRTFCGSEGRIQAKFSAAGALVVTESVDCRSPDYVIAIKVWDAATGNLLRTIATRDYSGGLGARFSPDGSRVLDGTPEGGVKIYDVSTGQVVWAFTNPPTDRIEGVTFSPDGRLLILLLREAAGDTEIRSARLCDVESRQGLRTLRSHPDPFGPVAFAPDGRQVLIVVAGVAEIRDVATGELVRSWSAQNHSFQFAVFTPNGSQVLMAENANDILLMDVETGQRLRAYPPDPRRPVVFAPEGRRVLTGSAEGAVQLWDAWTWTLLRAFDRSAKPFVFTPDGRQVVTGSADGTARLYDVETGERLASFPGQTNDVRWADGASSVVFSPDRRHALTRKGHAAELWEVESGRLLRGLTEHSNGCSSAVFTPPGSNLIITVGAWPEDTVRVWEADTGHLLHSFQYDLWWGAVASPDGQALLVGRADGLRLCDPRSGEVVQLLGAGADYATPCFSPDGTKLLKGHVLLDLQTGKALRVLSCSSVYSSAFSPNGREILTASGGGLVWLWDASAGQLLRTFVGAEYWGIDAVSFSPDGVLVAVETWDGVVDIWDLRDRLAGLRTSMVGGKLEMRWELGTLQSAEGATGPWQDMTNAVSPLQVDLAAGARFYRVRVEE